MIPQEMIDWLMTKNPAEKYDFMTMDECLAARYLIDKYGLETDRKKDTYRAPYTLGIRYSSVFGDLDTYRKVAAYKPWTYGAALDRALNIKQEKMR